MYLQLRNIPRGDNCVMKDRAVAMALLSYLLQRSDNFLFTLTERLLSFLLLFFVSAKHLFILVQLFLIITNRKMIIIFFQ